MKPATLTLPAALALCLATATPAAAHLGALSYSQLSVEGSHIFYRLRFAAHLIPGTGPAMEGKLVRADILRLEASVLEWLAGAIRIDSGGKPCSPVVADTIGPDANDDLELVLDFSCQKPVDGMSMVFSAFDDQLADYQNLVSVELGGRKLAFVLSPTSPRLQIPPAAAAGGSPTGRPASGRTTGDFFLLGVGHILGGYDHLLFLLGLLLLGGSWSRLAAVVTAFTVAHSLTLALAALGLFRLPAEPVELLIALSIVWVGSEKLRQTARDRRLPLSFGFGLVHGFAFAGLLGRSGLEGGELAAPLLGFNLGVEAGQALVLVPVLVVLRLIAAGRIRDTIERGLAWALVTAGVFWASERAAALFGL